MSPNTYIFAAVRDSPSTTSDGVTTINLNFYKMLKKPPTEDRMKQLELETINRASNILFEALLPLSQEQRTRTILSAAATLGMMDLRVLHTALRHFDAEAAAPPEEGG